jgi:hypothetical protein
MHQVRWLALGGLSLVLLVLILVHFTFLGTLLVRFYRRKNITTHNEYSSIHKAQAMQHFMSYYQRVSETNMFRKQSKF